MVCAFAWHTESRSQRRGALLLAPGSTDILCRSRRPGQCAFLPGVPAHNCVCKQPAYRPLSQPSSCVSTGKQIPMVFKLDLNWFWTNDDNQISIVVLEIVVYYINVYMCIATQYSSSQHILPQLLCFEWHNMLSFFIHIMALKQWSHVNMTQRMSLSIFLTWGEANRIITLVNEKPTLTH